MEQPGEGHRRGVVGGEESDGKLSNWRWGPLVLILLAMLLFIADLFVDERHPADIWNANIQVLLLIAACFWVALISVYQKNKE